MIYTVYYSYEDKPGGRGYIGYHAAENPYDGYLGSFYDKRFCPDGKIILGYFYSREAALQSEIMFQRAFRAPEDGHFANQSYQTSTKFHVPGEVSAETRQKQSEFHKGLKWWNNGFEEKMSRNTPGKEWTPGRLPHLREVVRQNLEKTRGRSHSLETRQRMSLSKQNAFWWISPEGEVRRSQTQPGEGWRRGRK
jgi:hypothetical protein